MVVEYFYGEGIPVTYSGIWKETPPRTTPMNVTSPRDRLTTMGNRQIFAQYRLDPTNTSCQPPCPMDHIYNHPTHQQRDLEKDH